MFRILVVYATEDRPGPYDVQEPEEPKQPIDPYEPIEPFEPEGE